MPKPSPAEMVAKAKATAKRNHLQLAYLAQLKAAGLPTPEEEVTLIKNRKFRWDFCYPANMIAIEINGGTWAKGGHSSGTGLNRDYEKGNLANLDGWCCLVFSKDMIQDGKALSTTQEALSRFPPF